MLMLQFISGWLISFWNLFIYVNNSQYTIYKIHLTLNQKFPSVFSSVNRALVVEPWSSTDFLSHCGVFDLNCVMRRRTKLGEPTGYDGFGVTIFGGDFGEGSEDWVEREPRVRGARLRGWLGKLLRLRRRDSLDLYPHSLLCLALTWWLRKKSFVVVYRLP